MDAIEAIKARRSIRNFNPDIDISDNEANELIELAMLSPTSFNIQHWKFLVIRDEVLRSKIREVSMDQAQVTEASLLIVVCADIKAWEKDINEKWKHVPETISEIMVNATKSFYENRDQLQRDEAIRSASLATQTLLMAAEAKGFASGPMVGFDAEKVADLINLPDDHLISNFVVIGKAIKQPFPRGGQLPLKDVLVIDKF